VNRHSFARFLLAADSGCYSWDRLVDRPPTPDHQRVMNTAAQYAASTIDPKVAIQAGKGDDQAFNQLYDQSSTLLFSLALRILGSREEAADILQEVYVDVWKRAVRYDIGRGTPIAWLIALTRSRAIDRLRASNPQRHRQTVPTENPDHAAIPGQFENPADQALRTVIRQTLEDLPKTHRQAIELTYYEGLLPAEIATQLDQPLDAVLTRLKLSMSKLHESLHTYWEQDLSA
jgi:RNA polymerase sigma-70 factor, ECF subfamily